MFLAIINDTYAEVKAELSNQKNEFEVGDYFKKVSGRRSMSSRVLFQEGLWLSPGFWPEFEEFSSLKVIIFYILTQLNLRLKCQYNC